jgi:hypothetical protein
MTTEMRFSNYVSNARQVIKMLTAQSGSTAAIAAINLCKDLAAESIPDESIAQLIEARMKRYFELRAIGLTEHEACLACGLDPGKKPATYGDIAPDA